MRNFSSIAEDKLPNPNRENNGAEFSLPEEKTTQQIVFVLDSELILFSNSSSDAAHSISASSQDSLRYLAFKSS